MTRKEQESKRQFLKTILYGSLTALSAAILYPIFKFLKPPQQTEVEVSSIKAANVNDLEKDSGIIVRFGNKPVVLIRKANGEFKAFSATCTHLDCTVQYRKDKGIIWCACHNGQFDLNGRNIGGPPPRPLEEFRVVIKGEEIFISKNL
jgi:Rieske Fe-S protein